MKLRYIAVHHSGGTVADPKASSQNMTAEQVNEQHKVQWNFKSDLGFYGGYNFFIDKNGKVTQFRAIGEETAANKGHNFDTVSICLAGNFNVGSPDMPTGSQKTALVKLIDDMLIWQKFGEKADRKSDIALKRDAEFDLSEMRIVPHRLLSSTECYGGKLSDSWARELYLAEKNVPALYKLILDLCYQIIILVERLSKKKTLGSLDDRECSGHY